MGKTTTIGKIASRLSQEANQSVLVAACDTFRAAAVDQLEEWTERAGVDIHKPGEGETKPAPVLDNAITKAIEGDYDVLIVDTSGRLSNNVALNEELKKLKRTIADRIPGGPQETLLVLDGAVGRNGVDQAKVWNREVGITGLVITKLDGTARGGVVVSIVRDVGVPVKLIGVGEGINDLRDFNPEDFVDALLGYEVSFGEGAGRKWREGRREGGLGLVWEGEREGIEDGGDRLPFLVNFSGIRTEVKLINDGFPCTHTGCSIHTHPETLPHPSNLTARVRPRSRIAPPRHGQGEAHQAQGWCACQVCHGQQYRQQRGC